MEYKSDISGREQGLVVDVGSLYAWLCQLEDRRHARGVGYRLVTVLVFVILAKLAGEDRLSGISEWVRLRQQALQLGGVQAPHRTTYSRILGHVVDPEQFEDARLLFKGGIQRPQR